MRLLLTQATYKTTLSSLFYIKLQNTCTYMFSVVDTKTATKIDVLHIFASLLF